MSTTGKIKITVDTNGGVSTDMSGFKDCAEKTKEMLNSMQLQADHLAMRDRVVPVQEVSSIKVSVGS